MFASKQSQTCRIQEKRSQQSLTNTRQSQLETIRRGSEMPVVRRHKMCPHFSRVPRANSETSAGLLLGGFLVFLLRVVGLSDHRQQLLELLILVISALCFLLLGFHLLLSLLLLSHQHDMYSLSVHIHSDTRSAVDLESSIFKKSLHVVG